MKTFSMILVVLGLSCLCLAPLSAKDEEQGAATILTFQELRANPESYRTTELTFRGQFHTLSDVFSSFFTYFTPDAYLNFSAWDLDAPIWFKEVYKSDFPFLYVAKSDRRICALISELAPYTRFEAKGRIQSVFDDFPWIQVTSFKVLPDRLNKDTIRYMAKGYALLKGNKFLDAAVAFHRAWEKSKGVPPEVRAVIRKEEGKCLYAAGSYEEAADVLDDALDLCLTPEDKKEVAFVLKEAEAMIEYLEDLEDLDEGEPPPPPPVTNRGGEENGEAVPPEDGGWGEEALPPVKEEGERRNEAEKTEPPGTDADAGSGRVPPPDPLPEEIGPQAPGSKGPGTSGNGG